ncbi:MAG TPA: DUF3137 domain-containing protein [Flavobacteriales bacterium]|nr:DUF3137 domain-containing protein [Flavobacteriales bacterium]
MQGKSFETFYDSQLFSVLQELEDVRLYIRKKILSGLGIGAGISALMAIVYYFITTYEYDGFKVNALLFFIEIPVIFGGIIGFVLSRKKHNSLKKRFKIDVIGVIISFIEESLSYDPKGKIAAKDYKKSKLFTKDYDRYKGDDHVIGKLGATQIEFSELHTQYETKDKDGKSSWNTIFKGIFFIADFNKNFKGETFIQPDLAERIFGFIGSSLQGLNKSKGDLVKMENVEFEKEFVVYSSDQVEARYILSPKLLQRIIDFKNKTGNKMHVSFINSKMYIGISLRKNLFEVSYFKSLLKKEPIEEFYKYLDLCIGIAEELDLNTRIWTKT